MKSSDLATAFSNCTMREVLLEKYGNNGPSTFNRNNTRTLIDGIWASPGIDILAGGYFAYDEVISGTDHCCLWIDLSFVNVFGRNMPPIVRPHMQRLHCKDPCLVDNFNRRLHQLYIKHNMLQIVIALEQEAIFPLSAYQASKYEALDSLRCKCVAEAEKKCRKLRVGQVAFSPQLQQVRRNIAVWRLLSRKKKGLKVSSRFLDQTLAKSTLPSSVKSLDGDLISEKLVEEYKEYYSIKWQHIELCLTSLDNLASALAEKGNFAKATILKVLRHREQQRHSARKIRYLRGKINTGSTTMVSIPDGPDKWKDLTDKKSKFSQSFHTPFYQPPISEEFGFQSLTPASQAVLDKFYEPPPNTPENVTNLLQELNKPPGIKELGSIEPCIPIATYRAFWRKANERVSCYPSSLSCATMKAGPSTSIFLK
jgi:hypothetical protein